MPTTLSSSEAPSSMRNKATKPDEETTIMALVPEDVALFGRLNAQLMDEWADLLEQALLSGIASLPLMQPDAQKNLMDNILRPKYWRNIDIAEVYAARNIFTLAMFPPKRRARIVQACLRNDDDDDDDDDGKAAAVDDAASALPLQDVTTLKSNQDDTKKDNDDGDDTSTNLTNTMIIPENIPTAQQLEELNQEGQALRQRLQQAKRRRAQAQQALQQAMSAAKLAQQAEEITDQVEEKTVVQAVTETLVGAQGLAELKAVGEELVKKMDEKKQNRSEDDDQDDIVVLAAAPPPKKPKTLQEQYQEDQKVVGAIEQLQQVQRLLQQQKDE